MAKKHFMCTHTFLGDEAKKMFEDASLDMTDRDMFAAVKTEKAEMLGHWRGEEDFLFCHWYWFIFIFHINLKLYFLFRVQH